METTERFMSRALELARRGVGRVSPNPPVGAVAVCDGQIVAEGFHAVFGGPHAERVLIDSVDRSVLQGATLYVTLEPCAHHGKTPPCFEAILQNGFAAVCYAVDDPNPRTRGLGVAALEEAGIEVTRGLLEARSRWLLASYLKHTVRGTPLVTAKWAMTLDGRIGSSTGDSKWISSPETLERTRSERCQYDAILIGRGTQAADDPLLTDRSRQVSNPVRVLLDSALELPLDSRLVSTAAEIPVLVFAETAVEGSEQRADRLRDLGVEIEWIDPGPERGLCLETVLRRLGNRSVTSVLVEGGSEIHGSFLDHDLIDRVQVVIGSKVIGGAQSPGPIGGEGLALMSSARHLESMTVTPIGDDVLIEGALSQAGLGQV